MTLHVRAVLMTCKHAMNRVLTVHLKSANLMPCTSTAYATEHASRKACHTETWSLMVELKHITYGTSCMWCKGLRHSLKDPSLQFCSANEEMRRVHKS